MDSVVEELDRRAIAHSERIPDEGAGGYAHGAADAYREAGWLVRAHVELTGVADSLNGERTEVADPVLAMELSDRLAVAEQAKRSRWAKALLALVLATVTHLLVRWHGWPLDGVTVVLFALGMHQIGRARSLEAEQRWWGRGHVRRLTTASRRWWRR